MICLSKADEGTFKHLSWNQSPAPLAAQSTTRQDLNGIANLRELVASNQDDDAGGGTLGLAESDEKWHQFMPTDEPSSKGSGAGRWSNGLSSCLKVASGGDGQNSSLPVSSDTVLSRVRGWIAWLASVLVVSYLLSSFTANSTSVLPLKQDIPVVQALPAASPINEELKQLGKRATATCANGGVSADLYNTNLHVGALFIIWGVSTLGAAFPLLAKRFPGLHIPLRFFFAVRHFGTGVLIATAFVHLLPTAFISLGNPCLSSFWIKDYPAIPGAIALAAIFFVTIIEMIFHPSRTGPRAQVSEKTAPVPQVADVKEEEQVAVVDSEPKIKPEGTSLFAVRDAAIPRGRGTSMGYELNRLQTVDADENSGTTLSEDRDVEATREVSLEKTPFESAALSPEQKVRKEQLQCMLLELGILFHSIFIGMALSVSVGNEFIVLLIAIIFHQTFEGLALGSRIAGIAWTKSTSQPWIMVLTYGCTTPLGQAIGIATHTLYSPGSEVGLIVVGVMNAISAGLLTYASLVELMSEDFLSDESWKILRGKKRVVACVLVFFGAFFMSLVGAWA